MSSKKKNRLKVKQRAAKQRQRKIGFRSAELSEGEREMTGTTSYKKGCTHNAVTTVWTIGKGKIIAGSRAQMEAFSGHVDLHLNLCGQELKAPFTLNRWALTQLPRKLFPNLRRVNSPEIRIDWPDGGVPKVGKNFWEDIVKYVYKGEKIVGIFCIGGHGRTGTALASIAAVSGVKGDIVEQIRKNYCMDAVESDSQIAYLKELGCTTECKPSRSYGSATSGGWSGGSSWQGGQYDDFLSKSKETKTGKDEGKSSYRYMTGNIYIDAIIRAHKVNLPQEDAQKIMKKLKEVGSVEMINLVCAKGLNGYNNRFPIMTDAAHLPKIVREYLEDEAKAVAEGKPSKSAAGEASDLVSVVDASLVGLKPPTEAGN